MFACNVHLVLPGSNRALSAHRARHRPLLTLPGSQTHCHTFHVRFLLKSEHSLREGRPLIPPQRKWPVLFSWHISTSPHKLLTRPLFGPCTSACKVRHRNRSYRWRDSEVSTLLLYLTMSFVMSWHFWLTLGGRNARKEQESLPQVHSIICWIKLFPTCFAQKVFTKTRQTWLQDWRVKLPLWLLMWDICPGLLPAAATEKKRNKITDWKLCSNELRTKHSINEWMRE